MQYANYNYLNHIYHDMHGVVFVTWPILLHRLDLSESGSTILAKAWFKRQFLNTGSVKVRDPKLRLLQYVLV